MDLNIVKTIKKLQLKFSFLNNNSFNSNNKKIDIHIHIDSDNQLQDMERNEATDLLSKLFLKFGEKFIGSSIESNKNIQIINSYAKSSNDRELRKFVREKLPIKDRSIWFSALILKNLNEKKEFIEVSRIKKEMISSYYGRGGNIANLCNAGYLESHIMSLYDELVEKRHDLNLFNRIYETIVVEFPFAVFVCRDNSEKEVYKIIVGKIDVVRKYGWKKVSVHGIGKSNVQKILDVLGKIKEERKNEIIDVDFNSFESNGRMIKVDFILK